VFRACKNMLLNRHTGGRARQWDSLSAARRRLLEIASRKSQPGGTGIDKQAYRFPGRHVLPAPGPADYGAPPSRYASVDVSVRRLNGRTIFSMVVGLSYLSTSRRDPAVCFPRLSPYRRNSQPYCIARYLTIPRPPRVFRAERSGATVCVR